MSGAGHPDRHLSDEQLSDLLDGPGDAVAVGHLSACPACSSRLEGWAAVASGLRSTVAVPPDRREAAVAAALAGGSRAPAPAAVWMRGRVVGVLAAVAAVIVAVAVGLSQAGGSGGAHRTTAGGSGSASSASGTAGRAASPAGAAPGAAGHVASPATADLGSLDGPGAVATAVDRALGALASAAPTASGSAVQGASGASGASGGSASASAPAAAPGIAVPAPAPACTAPTRLFAPGTTQLLLEGPATYRGVPAEVFAYRVGSARRAVVLSRASCAVLAQVPF